MRKLVAWASRPTIMLAILGFAIGLIGLTVGGTLRLQYHLSKEVCRNYRTLERLINQTPTVPEDILRNVGFTSEEIGALARANIDAKRVQLMLLGSRPRGCAKAR